MVGNTQEFIKYKNYDNFQTTSTNISKENQKTKNQKNISHD